jgi:hypothetical protein
MNEALTEARVESTRLSPDRRTEIVDTLTQEFTPSGIHLMAFIGILWVFAFLDLAVLVTSSTIERLVPIYLKQAVSVVFLLGGIALLVYNKWYVPQERKKYRKYFECMTDDSILSFAMMEFRERKAKEPWWVLLLVLAITVIATHAMMNGGWPFGHW